MIFRRDLLPFALLALVTAGAWPTVSVKLCVAAAPTPLLAVTVNA